MEPLISTRNFQTAPSIIAMLFGVDFDNTIVCYADLFHRAAVDRQLVPESLPRSKTAVRDYLRREGRENEWTALQGHVYGVAIEEARPYDGVEEFFRECRRRSIPGLIISHRTRRPHLGPGVDLHAAARRWIARHLSDVDDGLVDAERVFFEETRAAKMRRIAETGCTHFIDDLPEFLAAAEFPRGVERVLFDPEARHEEQPGGIKRVTSWKQIADDFL